MSASFNIEAELRTDLGKGASRRLRHEEKFPAVVYGAGKDPVSLTLDHKKFMHNLENEAFYSHILTLNVGGKEEQVVLKDLQRHPAKVAVMHADFLRVSAKEKLQMNVPLHFINEDACPGAKEGGLVTHSMTEVVISCLPKDLPEYLEVDLSSLELDHSLHMSDITLPAGVEIVELSHGEGHDQPIAACHMTRGSKGDEAEDAAAEAEGGAEPAAE
ncbi:MAG: 50S ribosomal protein L25/general stress protein Ctc [Gammaproteobacteria bacterium]|nr:50S ribosomal protein L25/general stress protein Ctc [Gammaproteobacteria bacterium]MDH5660805.1 50S ribosomal protein L25/general stress protein Ctc [Gammaproteobacteria bacterium]